MKPILREIISTAKVIALALVFSFGISVVFAWTGPTEPPPGGNTPAPLNVGAARQTKLGPVSINTSIVSPDQYGLDVFGISRFFGNLEVGVAGAPASLKIVDGNQAEGKVLTSNADGLARWAAPSGGGGVAGVSKITAGPNITVSPASGTGEVTVSGTGGGGVAGVSQIVAGSGVSISPSGGTGVVTVNATGGGSSCTATQSNVTSQRALNTVYRNTSGHVMFVNIYVSKTFTGGGGTNAVTDSSPNPTTYVSATSESNAGWAQSLAFPVLPGNYYKLGGDMAVTSWVETILCGGGM